MKTYNYLLVITVSISSTLLACKKKNEDDKQEVKPTVTITSPIEADTFQFGEQIHVHASATSTEEMHGYRLSIRNMGSNMELFSTEEHTHATSYTIHEHWVNNVSDTSHVSLEINVAQTHNTDGTTTKTIHFVCLP